MEHPCGNAQQQIRHLGAEHEKGAEGREVHVRIIFVEVTFEEIGLLTLDCGLDQE